MAAKNEFWGKVFRDRKRVIASFVITLMFLPIFYFLFYINFPTCPENFFVDYIDGQTCCCGKLDFHAEVSCECRNDNAILPLLTFPLALAGAMLLLVSSTFKHNEPIDVFGTKTTFRKFFAYLSILFVAPFGLLLLWLLFKHLMG